MNYYNEHDPGAAHWLRSLIAAGLIPDGHVDTRSIEDVKADELRGYTQCHFFAGIGGWPIALQLAGIPDDVRLWTGSCPCQPLSVAGKRKGHEDERHLWPVWYRLIRDVQPSVCFGEQAGESDGLEWITGVRLDLDELGYAVGAASLPAASVGAPHRRYRYFFVADAENDHWWSRDGSFKEQEKAQGKQHQRMLANGSPGSLPNPESNGREPRRAESIGRCVVADSGMGNASGTGPQGHGRPVGVNGAAGRQDAGRLITSSSLAGHWDDWQPIEFTDGKTRRLKSGIECLAPRLPGHVAFLRGLGNAIVPQVAALFIRAWLESAENSACTDGESE